MTSHWLPISPHPTPTSSVADLDDLRPPRRGSKSVGLRSAESCNLPALRPRSRLPAVDNDGTLVALNAEDMLLARLYAVVVMRA